MIGHNLSRFISRLSVSCFFSKISSGFLDATSNPSLAFLSKFIVRFYLIVIETSFDRSMILLDTSTETSLEIRWRYCC